MNRPRPAPAASVWRVRGRAAFSAFRHSPWRSRRGPLLVTFVPLEPGVPPRPPAVAYAVGKRVGGAVERNRLRRRLRPIVAELAREGALAPGDYLIGASAGASGCSRQELRRSLAAAIAGSHAA